MLFQGGNPMQQHADFLLDRVRHIVMIQFNAMLDRCAVLLRTTLPGTPTIVAPVRHLVQHNGVGADHGIVTDTKRAEDLGPGPNQHIVAQCRMPLCPFSLPVPPRVTAW